MGHAQFVAIPPDPAAPAETPTSEFSVAISVELAPSSRFTGLVEMSHG
jgi:hypothetical protein